MYGWFTLNGVRRNVRPAVLYGAGTRLGHGEGVEAGFMIKRCPSRNRPCILLLRGKFCEWKAF
jgi:hypothetical protein